MDQRYAKINQLVAYASDKPYYWVCTDCLQVHLARRPDLRNFGAPTSCPKCITRIWNQMPDPTHSDSLLYLQEPLAIRRRDVLQLLKYERFGPSTEQYWAHRNAMLEQFGQFLTFPVPVPEGARKYYKKSDEGTAEGDPDGEKTKEQIWRPEYAQFTANLKVINQSVILKSTWAFVLNGSLLSNMIHCWVSVCSHQVPFGAAMDMRQGQGNLITAFQQAFGRPGVTVHGGCRDCWTDFAVTATENRTLIESWRNLGTENPGDIAIWASQCTNTFGYTYLHRNVRDIGFVRDSYEADYTGQTGTLMLCSEGVHVKQELGVDPMAFPICKCLQVGPELVAAPGVIPSFHAAHSWQEWLETRHTLAPEPKSKCRKIAAKKKKSDDEGDEAETVVDESGDEDDDVGAATDGVSGAAEPADEPANSDDEKPRKRRRKADDEDSDYEEAPKPKRVRKPTAKKPAKPKAKKPKKKANRQSKPKDPAKEEHSPQPEAQMHPHQQLLFRQQPYPQRQIMPQQQLQSLPQAQFQPQYPAQALGYPPAPSQAHASSYHASGQYPAPPAVHPSSHPYQKLSQQSLGDPFSFDMFGVGQPGANQNFQPHFQGQQ